MTYEEAIERVIRAEVAQGQAAWEMVQDGYNGNIEEYIADYFGDYDCTEQGGVISVYRTYGGEITRDTERWDITPEGIQAAGLGWR